ncbi:hypothetical protein D6C93_08328 [Aureobasidium pullulans]|nr:hypothetical protein D6C93_08328 [Aureobasidium pullulans]
MSETVVPVHPGVIVVGEGIRGLSMCYNNLPAFDPKAAADDRNSFKLQLADSRSNAEPYTLGYAEPKINTFFSREDLLRVCEAQLGFVLSKICRMAQDQDFSRVNALRRLKITFGPGNQAVNYKKVIAQEAAANPLHVPEGLGNEQRCSAHHATKFGYPTSVESLSRIDMASWAHGAASWQRLLTGIAYCLGSRYYKTLPRTARLIGFFVCLHNLPTAHASLIRQQDLDATVEPFFLVSLITVALIFVSTLAFAAAFAFRWFESKLGAKGNTLLLGCATFILSASSMIVISDKNDFPVFCTILMLLSSVIYFAAMVHHYARMLKHSQEYIFITLLVTVLLLSIVGFALTRMGTFSESWAAVPVVLPFSAWAVYTYLSLPQLQIAWSDIPLNDTSGSAHGSAPPTDVHSTPSAG